METEMERDILKGMIVCGYPGVGKSSIAGWNNCIDLESSNFSQWQTDNVDYDWMAHYIHVATELANQGFTVLLSTHVDVIDLLHELENIPVVIFCPKFEMKDEWNKRLQERYDKHPSDKNARAWRGAIQYWDVKINALMNSGFPVYQPDSMNYDLRDYIIKIRENELMRKEL